MIPYSRQSISSEDVEAVSTVLQSDFLTQGPQVPKFEQTIRQYCNAEYAVAVNSATSALHVACLALGLGPGDSLWTSPNTFVASANCALYCGAEVDFVDIDPISYNLSVSALESKLAKAAEAGRLPRIVVAVHFAGQPCDMQGIHRLGQEYGFDIIEDASHAIGARYRGDIVGNCRYSDVTIFSFHPVKIITTGEGGMATTNSLELAARMRLLSSHGITRDPMLMDGPAQGDWYYQQLDLGFNFRMTDLQAALGISQMARLDDFIATRQQLVERYHELLHGLPLQLPHLQPDCRSANHLYPVQLDPARVSASRKSVFDRMRKAGVAVNVHYIPVHTQPYYRAMGFHEGMFPVAEAYYSNALSLPLFADLTERQQDTVVRHLRSAIA